MTSSGFFNDIMIRANRSAGRTSVGGGSNPRGERIWASLSSTGSAFVKRIPGAGCQHPKQLAGQLAYVNGKAKGIFGYPTRSMISCARLKSGTFAVIVTSPEGVTTNATSDTVSILGCTGRRAILAGGVQLQTVRHPSSFRHANARVSTAGVASA